VPVLVCNRTCDEPDPGGSTPGIRFWGSSFAACPQCEILATAASDGAAVVTVELPLARSEELRRLWPYFRDRRIDAYQDLLRRYRD